MSNLNIDDYSVDDLKELFDLHDTFSLKELNDSLIKLLQRYSKLGEQNYIRFLRSARNKMKAYLDSKIQDEKLDNIMGLGNDGIYENNETNETNEYVKSYRDDVYKSEYQVNRLYSVLHTENDKKHVLLPQPLSVEQHYNLPILRGQLNPNLKNVHTRILNIDSQFRQNLRNDSNNFTMDLHVPLDKVIKLTLQSIELRHCWYTFDQAYGTSSFLYDNSLVTIPNGNWSIQDLISVLNTYSYNQGCDISFTYTDYNGLVQITNNDLSNSHIITFYNNENSFNMNSKLNNNLGWILGFRAIDASHNIFYRIEPGNSITSSDIADVFGPKYVLLTIDDFNKNILTQNYITGSDLDFSFDLPDYYRYDLSMSNPIYLNVPYVDGKPVPSGLTISQAHTILEIISQREKNKINRKDSTNLTNVFARINITKPDSTFYNTIIDSGGKFNVYSRQYFGPVTIERLQVKLLNDHGQLLNIGKQDFSFTLLVEELYQY